MVPPNKTVYCIDTSSLLHGWLRAYPPKRFPGLWKALDNLIAEKRLVASLEVYTELCKKDDEVAEWAKERKEALFVDIDEAVQVAVVNIMANFPKLVDTGKGKSGGDPFVIALALARGLAVVTQEAGGTADKPRIPFVCEQYGIRSLNLLSLIDEEDWTF